MPSSRVLSYGGKELAPLRADREPRLGACVGTEFQATSESWVEELAEMATRFRWCPPVIVFRTALLTPNQALLLRRVPGSIAIVTLRGQQTLDAAAVWSAVRCRTSLGAVDGAVRCRLGRHWGGASERS